MNDIKKQINKKIKNRAPLLYYIKLCALFEIHWSIQTGVSLEKPNSNQNRQFFLSHVTLKFDGWPWKTIGHLFYTASSFVHHYKAIGDFKLEIQSGIARLGSIRQFLVPCDLEI